ncbi:MAG TPA: tyrosine-type recombinase/integrase [Thermoanaerobaculia bacterium]|nr:tyrosine-type recombinase/integrase [Thermoanaerobaculia bacterium]
MNVELGIQSFLTHGEGERRLSDRTLRAYESDLVQFRESVATSDLRRVSRDDLEQYVESLNSGRYRDTSIRRKVAALKVFFRFLEEQGMIEESPARKLRIRKPVETRTPNVLTMKEIKSLLAAPKFQIAKLSPEREESQGSRNRFFCAVRDNLIIETLFSTGIRIGELVALNVGDADLEVRKLRITGRGDRGRSLDLASEVVFEALEDYLGLLGDRNVKSEALFIGRSNTRLTIYSIENIFKKYARHAEIKRHVTPHALRHTMAAMLINNGADIREVQEILGHASILSTQVYTRMTPAPRNRRATVELNQRDRIMVHAPSARLRIKN